MSNVDDKFTDELLGAMSGFSQETANFAVEKAQTEEQVRIEALEREVAKVASLLSEHIEKFACAFAEEVGLDPTKIKMVQQLIDGGVGFKLWFEPFPSDSEVEMYRARTALAETSNTTLTKRNVELVAIIDKLIEAGKALTEYRAKNYGGFLMNIEQGSTDFVALVAECRGEK